MGLKTTESESSTNRHPACLASSASMNESSAPETIKSVSVSCTHNKSESLAKSTGRTKYAIYNIKITPTVPQKHVVYPYSGHAWTDKDKRDKRPAGGSRGDSSMISAHNSKC